MTTPPDPLALAPRERTAAQVAAIVERSLALATRIAREKVWSNHSLDDLVQEARIALWHAAQAYDPCHGGTFTGFAGLMIKRRLWRIQGRTRGSRISTGLPLDDLDRAASPDPEAPAPEEVARLHAAIGALTPREQHVIREHYLRGRTHHAIGHDLQVSRSAITLNHRTALAKLRTALAGMKDD